MKIALLIALAATGLVGCATDRNGKGSAGPIYETSTGRGYGMENDIGMTADPRGSWNNWRFGGDPSRVPPRLPSDDRIASPDRDL
ncbi:MAG: hypothetical protein JWQ71_4828 [Pedosphaera sp.]|nr:hypothetical protein [Pedosphaera sp.]